MDQEVAYERGGDEVGDGGDEDEADAKEDECLEEEELHQGEGVEGEQRSEVWTRDFQEPTTHAFVIRTLK